jgi:hypothetical protein
MKYRKSIGVIATLLTGFVMAQSRQPQPQKPDTVRALGFRVEGGVINFSEGEVNCSCSGAGNGLNALQEIGTNDTISTGDHGRAEILLEPGYYLRVAPDSEVRLLDLSASNLKLKVLRGSAILEIEMIELVGSNERFKNQLLYPLTVLTPQDDYAITQGGAYRFNVPDDSSSEIRVSKGLAIVSGSRVQDGMSAMLRNGQVLLTAKEMRAGDEFDTWNSGRSTVLVEANKALKKLKLYKQLRSGQTYLDVLEPQESAQATAGRVISARNGLVQFAEPGAAIKTNQPDWKVLHAGDSLTSGCKVKTAPENRLELSPSPGFDLFLGSDSEIAFAEESDGRVSVSLLRGSIVINCHPAEKARERNSLTVTADRHYEIDVRGVYRFNTLPDGGTSVLVFSGAVKVAGKVIEAEKGNARLVIRQTESSVSNLTQDGFDVWSSRRRRSGQYQRMKRVLGMGGMWYLNETAHQYTFVPMRWEHRSPYGGKYSVRYTAPPSLMPLTRDSANQPRVRSAERPQAN